MDVKQVVSLGKAFQFRDAEPGAASIVRWLVLEGQVSDTSAILRAGLIDWDAADDCNKKIVKRAEDKARAESLPAAPSAGAPFRVSVAPLELRLSGNPEKAKKGVRVRFGGRIVVSRGANQKGNRIEPLEMTARHAAYLASTEGRAALLDALRGELTAPTHVQTIPGRFGPVDAIVSEGGCVLGNSQDDIEALRLSLAHDDPAALVGGGGGDDDTGAE